MDDARLITVAIHTYDRALSLKSLLEREGVEVTLQNVNLTNPVVSAGVRLRIKESSLPLALRIIENQELFSSKSEGESQKKRLILVPVDFSPCSTRACIVAFHLAYAKNAEIILLHSISDTAAGSRLQLDDSLNFNDKPEEIVNRNSERKQAEANMASFTDRLLEMIKDGKMPGVKFETVIQEGLPEEIINQYTKDNRPEMIVMGTRGANTKERELIGSVTAEVLDTCRTPVLTIPDEINLEELSKIRRVLFFSNFDQEDILALDHLFHLLPLPDSDIVLVKIPSKKSSSNDATALNRLLEYCRLHYPQRSFSTEQLSVSTGDTDFERITEGTPINLIAVPNKKKNAIARLFNPGIAHRLLFHSDIPMMVLPV